MYLAKLTTAQAKEAFKKDPIVVIPVGSTEQHGTQSALGTDFMVPTYLADHVEDIENVIIAPTVPYGVCPYHLSFEEASILDMKDFTSYFMALWILLCSTEQNVL